MKKAIVIISSVVIAAGMIAAGIYMKSVHDYKEKVANIIFKTVELENVADGVYKGKCETGIVNAQVCVRVIDHAITDIELIKHDNGKGASAESILDDMILDQTTDVDAVSGATCSSKVIRKAVENALSKGC